MTRIAVGIVRQEDLVLVGVRPPGVPLAGMLEFPGGKVAAGETPAAAAVREVQEETGLTVEIAGEPSIVSNAYDHGLLELHFFPCRLVLAQREDQQPAEALPPLPPFTWRLVRELKGDDFPPANRALVAALQRDFVS